MELDAKGAMNWTISGGPIGATGAASGGSTAIIGTQAMISQFGPRPQDGLHMHTVAPPPCREIAFCPPAVESTDVLGVAPVLVGVPIAGTMLYRRLHELLGLP